MSRTLVVAVVTVVALVVLGLSAAPPKGDAAFPGANGKIVFVQGEINTPRHIWTMDPDGSGRTQLTFGDVGDINPSWSPDGQKIVFIREENNQFTMMLMNHDGSALAAVPNTTGASTPSFFPNGQKLLFDDNGELYSINPDGTGLQNITNTPTVSEGNAAISPDGLRIAIQTFEQGGTYSDVTIRDINGSNPVVVTTAIDADTGSPRWSPDSTRVVFQASGPLAGGSDHEIGIALADGSSTQVFADPTYFDTAPNFSPDGTKLVFQTAVINANPNSAAPSGSNPFTAGYISISDTNMTNRENISVANSDDYDPDWAVVPGAATPAPTTPSDTPSPTATPTPPFNSGTQTDTTTPIPTQDLIWGDNNCTGQADPVDALLALRHDAALPTNTGDCPAMGDEVDVVAASLHLWGDVDCDDAVGPVDTLKTLRYDAGLGASQPQDCPPIGSEVLIID